MSTTSDTTLLAEAMNRLARGQKEDLAALLTDVEVHSELTGTRVIFHFHCLRLDAQGEPRIRDLVRVICESVMDFAIPRKELTAAKEQVDRGGSSAGYVRLMKEATALFTDITQTGEGGELLLFVMAEHLLKLPQLICKMDLKTNTRMHVHGADGLHVGVDAKTKHLVLYWGESKIYQDASDAIRECLASLAPMLKADENGKGPADRDLQLLRRYADLDDEALEEAFRHFLDPKNEASNSLEFRGLCLVGFDSPHYPTKSGDDQIDKMLEAMKAGLPPLKTQISKRIEEEQLQPFGMHFLCVPFPSAEDFRKRVRIELGIGEGEPSGVA